VTEPTPATSPTTVGEVAAWLQVDEGTDGLAGVVAGVNTLIPRWKGGPPADGWGDDVRLGAKLLAGRLWRRRNSPAGVEAWGAEGAVYVQRTDPDVAMLLGLGDWTPPQVG
jgi:hypothetical protein